MTEINNSNDAIEPAADKSAGDQEKYVSEASNFIENTSLDKMLEIAEEALRKKIIARATEPRKWVMPEDLGE